MKTDICERKHGGVLTSKRAFDRAKKTMTQIRLDILMEVSKSLDHGLTAKEYSEQTGRPLNTISGRFTELARDGWIERSNDRRDGSAVWRATV